jgi:hypothetical protein
MFKKDLDACHTESGSERCWKCIFKNHLACYFSDPPVLCTFLTLIQALAMQFYVQAEKRDPDKPIQVYPLLLSLTQTINASETNPDISTISENDEWVLNSEYYVSPSTLPGLEIHYHGQSGESPL